MHQVMTQSWIILQHKHDLLLDLTTAHISAYNTKTRNPFSRIIDVKSDPISTKQNSFKINSELNTQPS